ncbi:putative ankyrin repeat protein RF_0381 [Cotesia glomerata]|uniref:putative ankyrin repeat protein RF_0381 n=1 Tax=Cotesia glomerata TaxID=32391 RepID=UPI001D00E7A8|nr:putative ankyrin repeat protein RF_0381 [Cotesia glomerata]
MEMEEYLSQFKPIVNPFNAEKDLQYSIVFRFSSRVRLLLQNGANVNCRGPIGNPVLHLAIYCREYDVIDRLLKLGADPHAVTTKKGYEGYTTFHIACLHGTDKLVKLLITEYQVNINAVAADGVQPIYLAVFRRSMTIIRFLIHNFANLNAEINEVIFKKFHENKEWRSDFGDKISLLTYSLLYDFEDLFKLLIECGVDWRIKFSGKTLLMLAVTKYSWDAFAYMVSKMSKKEINYRDNSGFTALHYLYKDQTVENYRHGLVNEELKCKILERLFNAGADINLSINGDSSTMIVNLAAKYHDYNVLKFLLPRQKFLPISQPLYYALFSNRGGNLLDHNNLDRFKTTIDVIVQNIKIKIKMGFPVLADEIDRMNNMIPEYFSRKQSDWKIYEDQIQEELNKLRNEVIIVRDKKVCLLRILTKQNGKLRQFVRNKVLIEAWESYLRRYST